MIDPAVALSLAAITYRGSDLNLSDPYSRDVTFKEMSRCLQTFAQVKGNWEIVWGPAGFRPGIVGLDISAMYVARMTHAPNDVVIAIRGTNFYSLTDWLSNLLIDQRPWTYGDSAAVAKVKVSASTAIGLHILQRLRSAPRQTGTTNPSFWNEASSWVTTHEARLGYALLRLVEQGSGLPADRDLLGAVASWVQATPGNGLSAEVLDFVHRLDAAVTQASSSSIDEAALLAQVERAQVRFPGGVSLLDFLRTLIATESGPVNIHVVGHSKGGPLAAALALWLADTQGTTVPGAEQWDPNRDAKISMCTFAAPTPGNSTFADHFRKQIADDYRVYNPLDVVPHAWNVVEVEQIPDLYDGELKILKGLVDALTPVLERLDYQHEAPAQPWGAPQPKSGALSAQIAFQHLDAYLSKFNLLGDTPDKMSFESLFKPIS
jgi:hypothetical protein